MIILVLIIPNLFWDLLGHAPFIPSGPVLMRHVLIIPDHFWVKLGLARIITGGPILIRLVLINPDLFRVLLGLCTYHFWRSGLDKVCTYHS